MPIRVLIADDHTIFREALRFAMSESSKFEVVGEATTGREAITQTASLRPDIIIIDISMPDLNGVDATRSIVATHPEANVIGLSAHAEERYVMAMFEAGAAGYIIKTNSLDELGDAIQVVMRGKRYISPEVAQCVIDSSVGRHLTPSLTAFSVLTMRERHVVQLIAEGHSSKEIAALINITTHTVETHRKNVMRKLDLHSVADLTRYAIREGLVEP